MSQRLVMDAATPMPGTTEFRSTDGAVMRIHEQGAGKIDFIWAHGWGQSHSAFSALASGLTDDCRHLLLDFPGFGGAPPPPAPWGTIEYSDLVAQWLDQLPRKPRIWIGHSFGCRVGVRLASRHPKDLDGLVLIAGAGIRPPVPLRKRITRTLRGWMFKLLKAIAVSEDAKNRLRERWGSADYRAAGELRSTFVKVVNEDLSADAAQVDVPVCLIYGARDTETPPSVGKAFAARMKNASLHLLPRYGHLDILNEGRFQVQGLIKDFVKGIFK